MSDDISGSDRFVQSSELEITEVPDGAMIYQKLRERVHYLNPTAVIVFELCGMNKTVDEVAAFIANSFDLSVPPAEAVRTCVHSLLDEGLIIKS